MSTLIATCTANYRALEQSSEEMVARETAKMDARLNKTMDEMSEMQSKLTGYATKLENMGIDPGMARSVLECVHGCFLLVESTFTLLRRYMCVLVLDYVAQLR